ncbi:hypothetical protein SPB21_07145 [Leptothoe sp. ISB3NOV94-8A]
MATLSDVLDEDLLINLAGDRYFERGVGYFERGFVSSLAQYEERITAEVHGTETYQVQLWLQDGNLLSRCTCPLGVEEIFCKHCVAVGLAWIAEPPPSPPTGEAPARVGTTMEDVRHYLAQQERETLVRMILDKAMGDARWREQLLMKAASSQTGGADITTFRRALKNAIPIGDFVDYYAAVSYADSVQSAINGLEDLLESGYASDVVELSEEAITLLEDALNSVDDSDGHLGMIIDQVQDLHHRACEETQPDPNALAERLFHMELGSGYGLFHNALESYADILGDEGRETYQQLVDAEWDRLPEIGKEKHHSFNYRRSQLNRMKETLVAATANLEELVTVIAKDLSQPSRYLQIARLYQDTDQTEKAIAWAEQGLNEFKDDYFTGQLGDFLIAAYEQQNRFDDAIKIVWQDFANRPSLQLYQKLKQHADKAHDWSKWRDRALDHIRQNAKTTKQPSYHRSFAHVGYSLLVELFLWEEDIDQAWQAAQSGGCSSHLWMRLADIRASNHPEDSLAIYQPAIEPLINQTNNEAYHQAIDLIVKVKDVMTKLDRETDFETFVAQLSESYKRKRNFIKFLKQRRLI